MKVYRRAFWMCVVGCVITVLALIYEVIIPSIFGLEIEFIDVVISISTIILSLYGIFYFRQKMHEEKTKYIKE